MCNFKGQHHHDKHSCGPIAVYNLLLYLGKSTNYKEIYTLCKCTEEYGTLHDRMTTVLNTLEIPHRYYSTKEINIEKLTHLPNPAIISYIPPKSAYGHYSLILGYSENMRTFSCINWIYGPLVQNNLSRKEMVAFTRRRGLNGWPALWVVRCKLDSSDDC